MARSDFKSFARKSHCLVMIQWAFIKSKHTSLTTFSLWMENWWFKNVCMLDKEKHKRTYIFLLLLQKLLSFLSFFPLVMGKRQLLRVLLGMQGQTRRAEQWADLFSHRACDVNTDTRMLLSGLSHSCPLHIDPDWPICRVTSHFPPVHDFYNVKQWKWTEYMPIAKFTEFKQKME